MNYILYLSRGGCIGGSQRQLYYLLTNLNNKYKPVIVCHQDGEFADLLRAEGFIVKILSLSPWRKFPDCLYRYRDIKNLTGYAKSYPLKLIHSSDLWFTNYMNSVSAALNIPSVLHVRAPVESDKILKYHFDKADSIIAISPRIKKNLLEGGIADGKIRIINDSVNLKLFSPFNQSKKILKENYSLNGKSAIGIVGRVEPAKRLFDFLLAAKQVVQTNRNEVCFFIIGEIHSKNYYAKLQEFIKENKLNKHVIFTGARQDMPEVLHSLDILVSLSGGSVMFEAMSCAKPVISAGFSTKENSVHIQDDITGLLVTSKKTKDLVEALNRLINDCKLRTHLGQNARLWAQEKFSHEEMAAKTQKVYEKLLN